MDRKAHRTWLSWVGSPVGAATTDVTAFLTGPVLGNAKAAALIAQACP